MRRPCLFAVVLIAPCIAFAAPSAAADSTGTAPPRIERRAPLEIVSNKPWLKVRVNGSAPQDFILDAGSRGSSVIARECADRLHLALGPEKMIKVGAGQGAEIPFTFSLNVTLGVAGDTTQVPGVQVYPFGHVSAYEGRRVDGTLGEDFLRRHVVELDYDQREVRIYDPVTYRYTGKAAPIPIVFHGGLAVAQAEMTPPGGVPIPCQVVIDTGVRLAVVWYHPFVLAHGLVAAQPHAIAGTVGGGLGGESTGDIGRLDALRIGGLRLDRPVAVFSRDTSGVFAGKDEDGLVGGEILRRFKVTFDYPHSRLMLEPRTTSGADFEYDMSGLFLVARGPDFKRITIQSVADGTPAHEAGLARGDEIVSVDGKRADQLTLDQVRDRLRRDGATCRLRVRRGDDEREVTIKLRRLV